MVHIWPAYSFPCFAHMRCMFICFASAGSVGLWSSFSFISWWELARMYAFAWLQIFLSFSNEPTLISMHKIRGLENIASFCSRRMWWANYSSPQIKRLNTVIPLHFRSLTFDWYVALPSRGTAHITIVFLDYTTCRLCDVLRCPTKVI